MLTSKDYCSNEHVIVELLVITFYSLLQNGRQWKEKHKDQSATAIECDQHPTTPIILCFFINVTTYICVCVLCIQHYWTLMCVNLSRIWRHRLAHYGIYLTNVGLRLPAMTWTGLNVDYSNLYWLVLWTQQDRALLFYCFLFNCVPRNLIWLLSKLAGYCICSSWPLFFPYLRLEGSKVALSQGKTQVPIWDTRCIWRQNYVL